MGDYGIYMDDDDCHVCRGRAHRPTAKELLQRQRERDMADGEARLARLLARTRRSATTIEDQEGAEDGIDGR